VFVVAVTVIGLPLVFLLGCGSQEAILKQETPVASRPIEVQGFSEYRIQRGDELDIKFFYNPELNETVFVRPDGKISLQLVDDVQAAGLTPAQLDEVLSEKYSQELRKPVVTVIVRSFAGQQVYVGGEVNEPGLVRLPAGMTALQAVLSAGGFRDTAKPEAAIVIRKGPDNRPIPLRIDLKKAIYGNGADTELHPYDIVYVPKTFIAEANKFVNQYVERLLLFRGFNVGFHYGIQYER